MYITEADFEYFLRLLLSGVCGILIGIERSRRYKEAGTRTHCLVCVGAALMMVVSKYGFADMLSEALPGARGTDGARIAAQVVSGIGFLGAGVIFRTGATVRGLTTAAGLWATSAVGLAVGAGMYSIGVLSTILIIGSQFIMHRLHIAGDAYSNQDIALTFYDSDELREHIFEFIKARGGTVVTCEARRKDSGLISYKLSLRIRRPLTFAHMQELMTEKPDIKSFSV